MRLQLRRRPRESASASRQYKAFYHSIPRLYEQLRDTPLHRLTDSQFRYIVKQLLSARVDE
jgi:hypothetical protein